LGKIPKVQETPQPPGKKGNINTVNKMKEVARFRSGHPLVRELAKNIVIAKNIPSHHYLREAMAVGDYVKRKVRYIKDADGIEQLHDPVSMINHIREGVAQGDCDDMALLMASLLLSIGHRPAFRAVRYRSKNPFKPYNHIYVVVYEKNPEDQGVRRTALDAIVKHKPIGFEVNHMSGKEWKV